MQRMEHREMWGMREEERSTKESLREGMRRKEKQRKNEKVAIYLKRTERRERIGAMVNVSAMTKEEARAYLQEKYGEQAKVNWTAPEIKERI